MRDVLNGAVSGSRIAAAACMFPFPLSRKTKLPAGPLKELLHTVIAHRFSRPCFVANEPEMKGRITPNIAPLLPSHWNYPQVEGFNGQLVPRLVFELLLIVLRSSEIREPAGNEDELDQRLKMPNSLGTTVNRRANSFKAHFIELTRFPRRCKRGTNFAPSPPRPRRRQQLVNARA